jgi:hypothetical protein
MMGSASADGGTPLAVEHVQVVAFYERDTGTIRHVHMVTTLAGGSPLSEDEAVADARAHYARRRPEGPELAIALSNDPEHGRRPHRIDPATETFVAIDDPAGS